MADTRGHQPDDDDEIIPLRTVPTYKTLDDKEYEGLPSYNEAIKDEVQQGLQETTEAPPQVRRTSCRSSHWHARPADSIPDKDVLFRRQYFTFTILVLVLFPGVGILSAGIYL
jgi:hypothetical protein